MKKALTIILLSAAVLLLGGCGKKENEDLNVLNHDFTEQEWSDFLDEKMAKEAAEAEKADADAGNSDSGSGNKSSETENSNKDNKEDKDAKTEESGSGKKVVVFLDPGHGGKFTGAVYSGVKEKTITLKTAKYAKDYLNEHYKNVECVLTRDDDIELADALKDDLEKRAKLAKKQNADALVSIHFNASDGHDRSGAYIYVSRRDNVKDSCKALAEKIMQELTELGIKERAIEQRKSNDMFDGNGEAFDYYAINRHCAARDIPGIIVEACFMDNEKDSEFINTEKALKTLGEAIADGIAAYFGLQEK